MWPFPSFLQHARGVIFECGYMCAYRMGWNLAQPQTGSLERTPLEGHALFL